ncbi:uncharacterized protein LOC115443947 [Manduca sexta]|uniref:Uncharacterized protein n=1 Tax=Manduca sexta TaxID=7130 RepID=A0A921Z4F2_MANSE|nr:uncharacterized protein LOC115443947 [Manduca sexta]KAG6450720.1 hypothetical protein O3G_MSEX006751 [Manduca sexta]
MNSQSYVKYIQSIQKLKEECLRTGMNEDEFRKIYFESLSSLVEEDQKMTRRIMDFIKRHKITLLLIMFAICFHYNFQYIYSSVVCSLQDYIYTVLSLLRKIFIPILTIFPSLTEYYHETCLIQNPFFTVVDMDCWPCSTVNNVREVENPQPVTNENTAPFIYKTDQPRITLGDIRFLYASTYKLIERDSRMVLMNNEYYLRPKEVFDRVDHNEIDNYYIWKLYKTSEARVLREIIKRPKVVPKFGQSLERYLIIDTSQKTYHLPDTECSFAYFLSLCGSRTIQLVPAEECKHQCKSLQVELKENYLLWYNWWYWKPKVVSSSDNSSFIGHLGSYCQM